MHVYQFFIAPETIHDGKFNLAGDEFRHCCRVLRKTAGGEIDIFDGQGRRWTARIESIGKESAECRITQEYPLQPRLKPAILLGVGILKSNLLDEIVVSATALGVAFIVPLSTIHSVKNRVNLQRLKKLSLAAMKQSGLAYTPQITNCQSLDAWIEMVSDVDLKMIAEQHDSVGLGQIKDLTAAGQVAVMIGPEGGFDETELRQAREAGFITINIFPYRLRTELAVVTALAGIRTLTANNYRVNHGN